MLQKWVSSEHESTQLEDKNEQPQDSNSMTSSGTDFSPCIPNKPYVFPLNVGIDSVKGEPM